MDCMSTREAAAKWSVSLRYVQRLLHENRIPKAKKYSGAWLIPADAEKPADPRATRRQGGGDAVCAFLPAMSLPKSDPDAALRTTPREYRELAAADLAYRRGDTEPAREYWRRSKPGLRSADMLSAATLATAAAISSGDYALYFEVESFLKGGIAAARSDEELALLSLPGALAAVGMAAPGMTPDWLRRGDFSLFPAELRPFLLHLHMLHLRNAGEFTALLYCASTASVLCAQTNTFTWLDLNFLLLAATASYGLGDETQAKKYLLQALDLGLPCGFVMPFADTIGSFGGLLERLIAQRYPEYLESVTGLWSRSFKNWLSFHNKFTKDNITTILTAQEYHVARCIVLGATCAQTAARMNLSVGRVKNILSDVYGKLYIQKRRQLRQFIL